MPGTLRVAFVGSPDLRGLLLEDPDADPERALTSSLSTSRHMELSQLPPQGWTSTLVSLRSNGVTNHFDVLLTSATAELDDPSRDPADALIELTRFVGERRHASVVVLNASTLLLGTDTDGRPAREPEPLDLRIRRLDMATVEASKATGLSVLDADRLVAEMRLPVKVRGVLGYADEVNGVLRHALIDVRGVGLWRPPCHGGTRPISGTDHHPLYRTVAQVRRGRCRHRGRPLRSPFTWPSPSQAHHERTGPCLDQATAVDRSSDRRPGSDRAANVR